MSYRAPSSSRNGASQEDKLSEDLSEILSLDASGRKDPSREHRHEAPSRSRKNSDAGLPSRSGRRSGSASLSSREGKKKSEREQGGENLKEATTFVAAAAEAKREAELANAAASKAAGMVQVLVQREASTENQMEHLR